MFESQLAIGLLLRNPVIHTFKDKQIILRQLWDGLALMV